MKNGCGRCAAAVAVLLCASLLAGLAGCGDGKSSYEQKREQVEAAATQFLDASGNLDTATVLSMFSPGYREANGLGDTFSQDNLRQAMGAIVSYSFDAVDDIVVEDGRGLVTVYIDYGTFGSKEETLVLVREGESWLVDNFTAMDWRKVSPLADNGGEDSPASDVEKALRSFLEACIDGDTEYVFKHLSEAYKTEHRLTKPWTAPEFAGIFGEARGYGFEPDEIGMIGGGRAQVDVTIDFGSRGNLESETSLVSLVPENGAWKVDVFPFFIY